MLDDIRRGDWVPRSVHKHRRDISQAISVLEVELNRDPTESEVANYLGLSLAQYHKALNDLNFSK
jgi:RNA polymerase sigma factor for flagellar operon FliA